MDTSDFAKRMKEYEDARKDYLTKRVPVMIRIDGKAFHTFTRGLLLMLNMDVLVQLASTLPTQFHSGIKNTKRKSKRDMLIKRI